jgi:hypothetical protein
MPKLCLVDDRLPALLTAQRGLVSREQALAAGLTARAIAYRLSTGDWSAPLPGVYLTHAGELSRAQRLVAALLYAGDEAAVDAVDAFAAYGMTAVTPDLGAVHVLVPWGSAVRSRGFVRVRRTTVPYDVRVLDGVRYVVPAVAAMATARPLRSDRAVLAVLSEVLQRRLASYQELLRAHIQGPPRGSRLADLALDLLRSGPRSGPEAQFRALAEASAVLPPLVYNGLLRLPGGELISPDALDADAGLVHETNGRAAHARADLFADLQQRHNLMTAAGLIVLHNPGDRIYRSGHLVIREFEQCHLRYAGRGLPAGVVLLRAAAG